MSSSLVIDQPQRVPTRPSPTQPPHPFDPWPLEAASRSLPGAAWVSGAEVLLSDLGFTLVDGDRPARAGSHLLVALRSGPTLRHFDPEAVMYYARDGERARVVSLDRSTALEHPERLVLWGHVHVVDRLRVENRFLTFGGRLRAAAVDESLTILDLWSPGPIVRWGGHSQGTDALAGEIGAFFGRLVVPVDFTPGAEARIDALAPEALYAAFLVDLRHRVDAARRLGVPPTELDAWLSRESARLSWDERTWDDGRRLVADLAL